MTIIAIDSASLDFMIDRIVGPSPSATPDVELGALIALWTHFKAYTNPVDALDRVQRRLVERGFLAD